jgi:hypothetical protein
MSVMKLRVTPLEGDPVSVPVTPKVIVAAERHFKKGMGQLFSGENVTFEALAWAAWQAMLFGGHQVKTFDLWLDGVASIDSEEDETVPFPEA